MAAGWPTRANPILQPVVVPNRAECMQAEKSQVKVFRVEQFRNPSQPVERVRELEAIESQPLDMSSAAVQQVAQARAGLEDFGPSDFKARLGRLLEEVERNKNVWKASKRQF